MLISPAYAQGGLSVGPDWMSFIPLILIGVVFYFFLIRPQQKKAHQHRDMLAALRRGDRVVTSGGLIGIIIKIVNEDEVQLEIAENVRVRVVRGMIAHVLAKTAPQKEIADGDMEGQDREGQAVLEKKGEHPGTVAKFIAKKDGALPKTEALKKNKGEVKKK